MMKKRILYVLMAAFVLASCSESEISAPIDNESEAEFSVKSSVLNVNAKPANRAAYEGDDISANPLTALVLASKTASYDYSTLHCEGTMTFVDDDDNVVYNKPVISGSHLFDGEGDHYLSALYPATGWTLASGKASRTLTGKEDVMFAPEVSTNKTNNAAKTYPELKFAHQLTLLRLSFSGEADAVSLSTAVTNIELTHVAGAAIKNNVEVDLSDGTDPKQEVTFSGSATTLPCYANGTDTEFTAAYPSAYPVTTAAVEKAYVLVPPTDILAGNGKEYTFKVYYNIDGEAKSLSVNLNLSQIDELYVGTSTKGYAFDIELNFIGGQIQATASVTKWEEGGTLGIDL